MAATMVPTEATVNQAISRGSVCEANAPATPTTLVASAMGRRRGCTVKAEGPASAPKITPWTRQMA